MCEAQGSESSVMGCQACDRSVPRPRCEDRPDLGRDDCPPVTGLCTWCYPDTGMTRPSVPSADSTSGAAADE